MIDNIRIKCLLAMALCTGCFVTTQAYNAVKLIEANNKETVFMLQSKPRVTSSEEGLVVSTDKEKLIYDYSDGIRFEFCDYDINAVESFMEDTSAFSITQDLIQGFNLKPGTMLNLVDLAGKNIKTVKVNPAGEVVVNISELPAGVYLLNSTDKNFKFYKK